MYYNMVYTTVNMKPEYMKKLEKLCSISRRSKTVEIECMIDKELQNLKKITLKSFSGCPESTATQLETKNMVEEK